MSETIQDAVEQPQETGGQIEAPANETQADQTQVAAAEEQQAEVQTQEEEPKPKPKQGDRRFANMTARLAAEAEARRQAEARAEAAEALLRVNRQGDDDVAPQPQRLAASDIDARAAEMLAQRDADSRRQAVVAKGTEEFGKDAWDEKASVLHGLGATSNPAFMSALVETENAPKIVAALADDTDLLMEIMSKPPAAMAARLGRMDAELSRPASKPISNAPTPPRRVESAAVLPEANIYDPKLSMAEWAAQWDKYAPPHLGGKRRSA